VATAAREFGPARLDVPTGWVTLDRGPDHVTWGEPGRAHTVTLASIEAGTDPLPGVVAAVAAESARTLPGARAVGRPVDLELDDAPRDDVALLARYEVASADGDAPLHVAQSWRRDTRAGLDVVATWTSADGHWPISPRSGIPRATASR
jgi:hypothetical protein